MKVFNTQNAFLIIWIVIESFRVSNLQFHDIMYISKLKIYLGRKIHGNIKGFF